MKRLLPLLLLVSCRTQLVDPPSRRDLQVLPDQVLADQATPDLPPPDLTPLADLTPPDLTPPPDLMRCLPPPPPEPTACPCGSAGLCQPATGRLVVQTRSPGGIQRLIVMDDNGCRRVEVSRDLPLGTPKWAADGERLAYVTSSASGSSAILNIVRVSAAGEVVCRGSERTRLQATDVAWASESEVWLFSSTQEELVRWRIGGGIVSRQGLGATRFDATGEGPLVYVRRDCPAPGCPYSVVWRPLVATPGDERVLQTSTASIGPVRLSRDGRQATWELAGLHWQVLDAAGPPAQVGQAGDRSPVFALGDGTQALVHTRDDGQLRYYGLADGAIAVVPPTWANVYSPDWSLPPIFCQPRADCL